MTTKQQYTIITPVRNEQKNIEKTIKSVIQQTIIPSEWIIVNDGSTDSTGEIINKYCNEYSWIISVHRKNRGFRKSGQGVIEAFYDGYNKLKVQNWNYLVKLDGDLSFDSNYFENCFKQFDSDNKLGIGGGLIVLEGQDNKESSDPPFHVRGATKIYKRECWNQIDGIVKMTGWDTIDELMANMYGWNTYTFENLKLVHYRHTGGADGTWKNYVKNGIANYTSRYHPLFMLLKCVKRLSQKPVGIVAAGLFWGFLCGYIYRKPRINDKRFAQYVHRQQLNRLLMKKSIWN